MYGVVDLLYHMGESKSPYVHKSVLRGPIYRWEVLCISYHGVRKTLDKTYYSILAVSRVSLPT
jgi:hypothetical protein